MEEHAPSVQALACRYRAGSSAARSRLGSARSSRRWAISFVSPCRVIPNSLAARGRRAPSHAPGSRAPRPASAGFGRDRLAKRGREGVRADGGVARPGTVRFATFCGTRTRPGHGCAARAVTCLSGQTRPAAGRRGDVPPAVDGEPRDVRPPVAQRPDRQPDDVERVQQVRRHRPAAASAFSGRFVAATTRGLRCWVRFSRSGRLPLIPDSQDDKAALEQSRSDW